MIKKYKNMLSTNNYLEAKKFISVCNLSDYQKIVLIGPDSLSLLNHFSTRNLLLLEENCFCTVFMKNKKFICEAYIFKLSTNRYIVISEDFKKLFPLLKKKIKKYPLVTVELVTKKYSFFAYHGDKALNYYTYYKKSNLYIINHQGYKYPCVISEKNNVHNIINRDLESGIVEISIDIHYLFLNSHRVLTNLDKLKRKPKYDIVTNLYYPDNKTIKRKKYVIKQFEASLNFIVPSKITVLNDERKKIGSVHNFYRISNKKNPFFLAIIKRKYVDKLAIIKPYDQEILLREYGGY